MCRSLWNSTLGDKLGQELKDKKKIICEYNPNLANEKDQIFKSLLSDLRLIVSFMLN